MIDETILTKYFSNNFYFIKKYHEKGNLRYLPRQTFQASSSSLAENSYCYNGKYQTQDMLILPCKQK
jgi:hypothetical protein